MDYNKLQIDGTTSEVIDLEDIVQKWNGFGWFVQRVDGHDIGVLEEAVLMAKAQSGKPSIIICDTIKAKGFSPAQGLQSSHHMAFTKEVAQKALDDLLAE
jgi:transketolase